MVCEAKNLDTPDDKVTFDHGHVALVSLPGATIGRATFAPGWRWSTDVKPLVGTDSCQVAHTGYIVSGRMAVRTDDGTEVRLGPGDAHVVDPGHDAWVLGDEPLVVIDFADAGQHPSAPSGARMTTCPACGVEFRIQHVDGLDHLVAAVQEHAAGSHGHDVSREHILSELVEV